MALLHFFEEKVDIAILEVGMGGRLDATNVTNPLLSIITNIAYDHQQYLGNTLSKIAFEKAGIIKRRNILISAATQASVVHMFKERCDELKTVFYRVGKDLIGIEKKPRVLDYQGITWHLSDVKIGLAGSHQITNATTALGALEILGKKGYHIDEKAIRLGLRAVQWPGRLEVVRKTPLILLDGAHNPAAMKTLRQAIERDFKYRRMILVLGIMADKDIRQIIKEITPLASTTILTRPHMDRSAAPALLKRYAERWCKHTESIDEVKDAVSAALAHAEKNDLILITGSLFTVGEARHFLIVK
jgi:dihydrofolate synthase/folylpolyglutamate synthase